MKLSIVLVGGKTDGFSRLKEAFEKEKIDFSCLDDGRQLLDRLSRENMDVVLIKENLPDMTGRQLVEKIVFTNPMMDCVVLSDRTPDDFHEVYEGLGVLMQFPMMPDTGHVQSLLAHLTAIKKLSGRPDNPGGGKIS